MKFKASVKKKTINLPRAAVYNRKYSDDGEFSGNRWKYKLNSYLKMRIQIKKKKTVWGIEELIAVLDFDNNLAIQPNPNLCN